MKKKIITKNIKKNTKKERNTSFTDLMACPRLSGNKKKKNLKEKKKKKKGKEKKKGEEEGKREREKEKKDIKYLMIQRAPLIVSILSLNLQHVDINNYL